MGETAAWHRDERVASGLHINRLGSEQMSALDEVGGGRAPNRRITADSFRLLTAKLKNKQVAVEIEQWPEPVIPASNEFIQETSIAVSFAEAAPPEEISTAVIEVVTTSDAASPFEEVAPLEVVPTAEIAPPVEVEAPVAVAPPAKVSSRLESLKPPASEKSPWAWLKKKIISDLRPAVAKVETETPVAASEPAEIAEPTETVTAAPAPEPWREIPFDELFPPRELAWPVAGSAPSEPVAQAPEPEPVFVHPEIPPPGVEEVAPVPIILDSEQEPVSASEPELVSATPEVVEAEPAVAYAEPETEAPVAAETVVPAEETIAPTVEAIAPVAETIVPAAETTDEPVIASEPANSESPAADIVKPPGRRKSQLPNGKLGEDHLPTSGMVVHGISEIAKAIYMMPTSDDRAAFLGEVTAMAAAEAAWELQRANLPSIVHAEVAPKPKPQIRKAKPVDDPFAKLDLDGPSGNTSVDETDEDAGELARSLLDMMLSNPSAGQPQERALAADALLKLVPRIPLRALVTVVDRLSLMDAPPHLLVSKLIHDPRIEVAGPLLEHCNHISDQVLAKVIATGQVSLLRLIARRRHISANLSDQLIEFDDPSVILTLVRNSGAAFSHHAFPKLADHAQRHHALLAPFATRPDLPAPIAFELFWFVPAELRRYLLSRFLTDSETLTKILKITHAMGGGEQGMEDKFPEREQIETLVEFLDGGRIPEAAGLLAEIAAIHMDNATRIIADANGEPLTIALKAIGTNRVRFGEIIDLLKTSDFGIIASSRSTAELQNIFDSMSFNKARVLLTYWDWAVLKSGPYAPAN